MSLNIDLQNYRAPSDELDLNTILTRLKKLTQPKKTYKKSVSDNLFDVEEAGKKLSWCSDYAGLAVSRAIAQDLLDIGEANRKVTWPEPTVREKVYELADEDLVYELTEEDLFDVKDLAQSEKLKKYCRDEQARLQSKRVEESLELERKIEEACTETAEEFRQEMANFEYVPQVDGPTIGSVLENYCDLKVKSAESAVDDFIEKSNYLNNLEVSLIDDFETARSFVEPKKKSFFSRMGKKIAAGAAIVAAAAGLTYSASNYLNQKETPVVVQAKNKGPVAVPLLPEPMVVPLKPLDYSAVDRYFF